MIQDLWTRIQLQNKAHGGAEVTLESGQPQRTQKGKAEETQYPRGYEKLPTSSTLATSRSVLHFKAVFPLTSPKSEVPTRWKSSPPCVSPPAVCPSCAPRQLRHSRVCTVTDSCTPDELTRNTISLPAVPGPTCAWAPGLGNASDPACPPAPGGARQGAPNRNWFVL